MSEPNLVIERIRQTKETGKLWDFPGGIHPMENKTQSNTKPIRRLNLPRFFYVPLVQHSGWAGELLVKVGDNVLKGQPLTKGDNYRQLPVHSPTSGRVIGIEPYASTHASGLPEMTVIIETDGKDEWVARQPIDDFMTLTSGQIIQKVYQYGIAGLGGAVFPTASKLNLADKRCKVLIINGAECEPYITCDDRLMQDYTADLIEGVRILRYVLRPEEVVIAVEDNKPHAIRALEKALKGANDMFLRVIPTKYPSGASDQLVQLLTGLEIPYGKRSIEMGIVMHNVGTAFAIKRAIIDDEPLIERVVTLTGDKIRNKGNVWARLGTPIQHLLEQVDYQADKRFPVFLGGPMTGFILPSLQAPITKTANCLIAPDHFEYAPPEPERSCIRCSSCSDACPVGLLPQQLYWFARSEDHDKSKEYHLDACIECGVCAYVCPSYIPLIQYFRQEKAKINEIDEKARKAEEAKIRFEAREARLQKEKEARTARISQAAEKRREEVASAGGVDPVKAALERLKAKKADASVESAPDIHAKANGEPDNSELMAQRRARRLAKQAEQAEQAVEKPENAANAETDSRKAAVAAALARAKAKKAEQAVETAEVNNTSPVPNGEAKAEASAETETDPRKAAVAAALARAKAKKATQAVENAEKFANVATAETVSTTETNSDSLPPSNEANAETETDPRKAAVAAALARAKAKKAAQAVENAEKFANVATAETVSTTETNSDSLPPSNEASAEAKAEAETDPRKAAVAAALARAKAKKAAQAVENTEKFANVAAAENSAKANNTSLPPSNEAKAEAETDPRKAAVAAAIARAKAKKAAQNGQN